MSTSNNNRQYLKILYGILFMLIIPLALVLWAKYTEPYVPLPVMIPFSVGLVAAICGAVIMAIGMITLIIYGDGLPMNAFPPRRYVHQGIYRLIPHPIYLGFSLLGIGCAILLKSPSGIWLVSPITVMSCVSLVQGYEKHDLADRFGHSLPKQMLALPSNEERTPHFAERLSVYLLVLLPWLVLYEAISLLGVPKDAIIAYLPFEKRLPVYEWTEISYGSTYLFVLLVPITARSSRILREFSIAGLIATGFITLMFIGLPLIAPPREFSPQSFLRTLLMWERAHDTPGAAFPSFHVVWAYLAAWVYSKTFPSLKAFWWLWMSLISISCIATGMHAIVDVLAGLIIAPLIVRCDSLWEKLRSLTERIANSWKEWHVGSMRIINHGIYAGVGTFLGLSVAGTLLGPNSVYPLLIVAFSSLIMAGLWAQYIEGSPSLLRPFGYYGGVIGVVLGSLIVQLCGGNVWLLLGAFAVTGPLIQAMGRLRCLVQGCCHGREASPKIGIQYTHPRSRVCRLTNLAGVPLHPTPLYSILWNIVSGIILCRLWSLNASLPLIAGLYLIFNGLGRFVEESYRGEPQTSIFGKLRLYQLMSIVSVVSGAVLTTINTTTEVPLPEFNWVALVAAAGFGMVTWFALGMDFPNSNRRFARLT